MSKKLIQNSMNNDYNRPVLLLTNKEIMNHKKDLEYRSNKKNNKSVYDRLYNTSTKNISKFVEQQESQRREKEELETKFIPKTNKNSKFGSRRRSMNDFFNDMKNFNRKKEFKIREKYLRKAVEEERSLNSYFTNKAKSKRARSPNLTTINNLYDRGVKKQLQRSASPENKPVNRSIIPKINKRSHLMVRDKDVSDILYNDASARK